jgi:hypothetical protein
MKVLLACLGAALVLPLPGAAQELWPLPRLEQPIRLDGIPDEPAWSAIEPLPMVSFQPVFVASAQRALRRPTSGHRMAVSRT